MCKNSWAHKGTGAALVFEYTYIYIYLYLRFYISLLLLYQLYQSLWGAHAHTNTQGWRSCKTVENFFFFTCLVVSMCKMLSEALSCRAVNHSPGYISRKRASWVMRQCLGSASRLALCLWAEPLIISTLTPPQNPLRITHESLEMLAKIVLWWLSVSISCSQPVSDCQCWS